MGSPAETVDRDDVWLVVPVYNEAPVIAEVLTQALRAFPRIVCVLSRNRP